MDNHEEGRHHDALSCSFCGKGQRDIRKLIAGPEVFICDECVNLCVDIMLEESKEGAGEMSAAAEAQRAKWQVLSSTQGAGPAAARLVEACKTDPRVPPVITDLAAALSKHLNPIRD